MTSFTKLAPHIFFLLFFVLNLCCGLSVAQVSANGKYFMYAGTYTDHGGEGIYVFGFDSKTGMLTAQGLAAKSDSPSFLAVTRDHKSLYAVNEIEHYQGEATGALSAFAIAPAMGKLSLLNQVSAHDPGPAYISLDQTGRYALIANYPLGSVAVFPILANGSLGEASDFVRHHGSSVKQNQAGPHGHMIELSPDNRFAIAADLGLDELIAYPFDASHGKLGDPHATRIEAGSGPRHFVFSPDGHFVYLINEMAGTITALAYQANSGDLHVLQTISTLPPAFQGTNSTAEIVMHPSGKFLYGSNRGDDSIVLFSIDRKTGRLTFVERTPTQGKEPRNFALDPSGNWLLAANQKSNNIVTFRVNQQSGRLTQSGPIVEIPQPVCLVFTPEN